MCGEAAPPTSSMCPAPCEHCAGQTECWVQCNLSSNDCNGQVLNCPAGLPCRVHCSFNDCLGTTVVCPPDGSACVIDCGSGGCVDLTVQCGGGPCSLDCASAGTCSNAVIDCGDNACSVICDAQTALPMWNAGNTCQLNIGADCVL